jgi:sugar lactone lactonase YvrE
MKLIAAAFAILILVVLLMILTPSRINPEAWEPAPNPGLVDDFAPNTRLDAAGRLLEGVGEGPEAIAVDAGGNLYTGYEDGRILRFDGSGQWHLLANTGGRPLGMKTDAAGNLVVADGHRGLLSVTPGGDITVLVNQFDGRPLRLVDDLDIAADGTIWFSDASTRFGLDDFMLDILEGSTTGRLLSYQPATGAVTVHLNDLFFANGVALGPDDSYVLVAETGRGTIRRLWLTGERAGSSDLFHSGLPGHPDNITFNGSDTFWVALPAYRDGAMDNLAGYPRLRGRLAVASAALLPETQAASFVLGLDLEGNVRHNLQGAPESYHNITSAIEIGERLYLGSLTIDAVSYLPLDPALR